MPFFRADEQSDRDGNSCKCDRKWKGPNQDSIMTLPDGPTLPTLLLLIQWIARPYALLNECAERYGDPFTVGLSGGQPMVFFSNPQAIQQLFAANTTQVVAGRSNALLRPLVGNNSLLLLDGERHQRERRLLMPPFHGDRMRTYGQMMRDITQQVASQWQVNQTFVMRESMQEISLRVILQAVFGLTQGDRYEQLRELLSTLLQVLGSPLGSSLLFFNGLQKDWGAWSPWGRFLRQMQQIDQLLYAAIRQRRSHLDESSNDILSLLLAARDEAGQLMSEQELRDELLTLLIAGHETTASALAWAIYWIHQLPEVKARLLQELDSLGPDAEPMAIAQLPYLNAVCQETLRIYPIVPIAAPRITQTKFQVLDWEFEPETRLVPCIYLTHRRLDLYPEPDSFRPERFLERQFSPYEFLPFGGGSRRCIGLAFALFEMKLVLATILSGHELAIAESRPVHPSRRGITLAPSTGVRMVLTGQRQPQPTLVQL